MAQNKVEKVMHEYKEGELHSGSKKGPEVRSRKQAIAIGLSEAKKSDMARRMHHTKNLEHARKGMGRKSTGEILAKHR